ncbi:CPBP family intramembrane metalloprotease [Agromyces atrinae]|uniref:CPBP family intramembrane glutamic endopeptidase n=1 Tax=Agromyces atrinae TaxID=592376 RepID=UPI001F568052|nr:CPBP family intramembrane glutamic endopeptidase [Agromyces atrinae]MCI2957197.1 CPBP family intramembrane metalloprotease [Agromyces atrinae]
MRIAPRIWIGLAVYAAYVIVVLGVTALSGVAYTDIGTSAEATWRGAVMDLAAGAVLLIIVTTLLGWWRPALSERQRSRHTWPIFVPILMFGVAVLNIFSTDWAKFDASFLLSLLALGVLVGFCEELMARGVVLTAFRSRLSEGWVWFLTSALFGLMHVGNALIGAPLLSSLSQAVLAFATGTTLYILRRVTGSLVWAMLLHGLWDVSVFAVGQNPLAAPLGPLLGPIIGVLSLAVVYWVIKGANEKNSFVATA